MLRYNSVLYTEEDQKIKVDANRYKIICSPICQESRTPSRTDTLKTDVGFNPTLTPTPISMPPGKKPVLCFSFLFYDYCHSVITPNPTLN